MPTGRRIVARVVTLGALLLATLAQALPIQLKDSNGTQYNVNTQVDPFQTDSLASGALTNATYTAPTTVTNYYYFYTFFGGTSTATVKYDVNVPLTPSFDGFNGLLITSVNGTNLPSALVFNPGQPIAGEDCPASNGDSQQLIFATQTFDSVNLTATRKVFVAKNKEYARWLNVITNTGPAEVQIGISLRGFIASGDETLITSASSGSTIGASTTWFTSSEITAQGFQSFKPKIGYVVQNTGATVPATSVGIDSDGHATFSYTPTIQPGASVILLTFVTVQGKTNAAENTVKDLVTDPLPSDAISCMSEQELAEVVNFPPVTTPTLDKATVKLKFDKTDKDTVEWKGKVTIGAGVSLEGLPVTVDFGTIVADFVLDKNGRANNGGGNKFNLQAKLKDGVTKAANVKFSFNLKGGFQDELAAYGLTNTTVSDATVTIPLTISVSTAGSYAVNQAFTYNATEGKSGKATAP